MLSAELEQAVRKALGDATRRGHEFSGLEHLLLALLEDRKTAEVIKKCGGAVPRVRSKLEEFLSGLTQVYGKDMLRYKGVLYLKDNPNRVVFQGVHMLMGGDMAKPWAEGEQPASTMVFIGRNLPEDLFVKGLEQCLVKAQ